MKKVFLFVLGSGLLVACNNTIESVSVGNNAVHQLSEEEINHYLEQGDAITAKMQEVLLQNVQSAMKKGGPEFAVDFCNTRAIPLTDSISENQHVRITRLSDKNRNPSNALSDAMDVEAWKQLKTDKKTFVKQSEDGKIQFYKPIELGMPACLKCHGTTKEISPETATVIAQKYPEDKAIDYSLGDLRGMWKVEF